MHSIRCLVQKFLHTLQNLELTPRKASLLMLNDPFYEERLLLGREDCGRAPRSRMSLKPAAQGAPGYTMQLCRCLNSKTIPLHLLDCRENFLLILGVKWFGRHVDAPEFTNKKTIRKTVRDVSNMKVEVPVSLFTALPILRLPFITLHEFVIPAFVPPPRGRE